MKKNKMTARRRLEIKRQVKKIRLGTLSSLDAARKSNPSCFETLMVFDMINEKHVIMAIFGAIFEWIKTNGYTFKIFPSYPFYS